MSYTCAKTLHGHEHTASCVEFLPSGDQVVSCSRDKSIKVWEVATGYCIHTLNAHSEWVRCLAVSPDGHRLASGGNDQAVVLWNLADFQPVHRLRGHEHFIQALAFSRRPLRLENPAAVAAADEPPPPPATEEKAGGAGSADADANALAQSASDAVTFVASASRDSTIRVWNAEAGTIAFVLHDHSNWVNELAFHPNGKYLLSASDDRAIKVMDLNKRRCLRSLDDAHEHFVTSLSIVGHISRLVSGGVDCQVRVWELR